MKQSNNGSRNRKDKICKKTKHGNSFNKRKQHVLKNLKQENNRKKRRLDNRKKRLLENRKKSR